jgi:hypothetical protein
MSYSQLIADAGTWKMRAHIYYVSPNPDRRIWLLNNTIMIFNLMWENRKENNIRCGGEMNIKSHT